MDIIRDYRNGDAFEVFINEDGFINPAAIIAIYIANDVITIMFRGERYKESMTLQDWQAKPLKIPVKTLTKYFSESAHNIRIDDLNRSGILTKTVIYYNCIFKTLQALDNNEYELKLRIIK